MRRCPRRNTPQRVTPSAAPSLWGGFDGLDASNYLTDSPGITSMGHVQAWLWIESQAVASANRIPLANVTAATGGWRFLTSGSNAALNFGAYDTNGSLTRISASLTLTSGHIGRPLHVCGGVRSGQLLLWVDGALVGVATAFNTYGAPASPSMSVGRRLSDTLSAQGDIRVIGGVSGGSYVPSDAEVLAAYNAGLAAKDISPIAGSTSYSFKSGAGGLTATGSPQFIQFS